MLFYRKGELYAERTKQAVEYIFRKLYSYKNPNEDVDQAWENVQERYDDFIYGPENKRDEFDYDDRIKALMTYLNLNEKYNRSKWLEDALIFKKKEMRFEDKPGTNLMTSDYWQFQIAAQLVEYSPSLNIFSRGNQDSFHCSNSPSTG